MNRAKGIVAVLSMTILLAGIMLIVECKKKQSGPYNPDNDAVKNFSAGSIPIFLNGTLLGNFASSDSQKLVKVSFTDKAENKVQEGWYLKDVLALYSKDSAAKDTISVRVSSSSRNKAVDLRIDDVKNESNKIILAMTKHGTLKLVSVMTGLDTREKWIQSVDRIEIIRK